MDKNIKIFFGFVLLAIIGFTLTTDVPKRQRWGFFSDEAGYYAITQSLVHDRDIQYTLRDLQRIKQVFPSGPVGIFLKRVISPSGTESLYYAKSFAYPMTAAPFFALFGVKGLLLCNGLMIFFSLLMGYYFLKQYHPAEKGFKFTLVFILATVTPVYIWWITADLFNFFVLFSGLFFFFYPFKRPGMIYISALFFSLSFFSKPWNAAAIAIIYLILLYKKQWKQFLLLSLITMAICALFIFFLYAQTGELSYSLFMGGDRRSFNDCFPYETPDCTFERGAKMTFDTYWDRFFTSPQIIVINLFYFFFGRFTGMLIYFPVAFCLFVLFWFQRKTPEDWFVLVAITTAILVFTLLAPDNYFGGSGAIGNRYFFNIFPLFFFLGYKNRLLQFSLIPVGLALLFLTGIYVDSSYHSITPRYAGISFPINCFPPEKTQYLSLPTNENPRAFGIPVHDGEKAYQVYFINDNYHPVETDSFWTEGDKELELFVATPEKVKTFIISLTSFQKGNKVWFTIENTRRKFKLEPERIYQARFEKIDGLAMKDKYIYHFKIKSAKFYCGYMEKPGDQDQRRLGVRTHIGVEY